MQFTWGFLLLFIFLIIPGMIIRRLYFFGEFSKQFGYYDPIVRNIFYSLIPGIFNAIISGLICAKFITPIDLKNLANICSAAFDKFPDITEYVLGNLGPILGTIYAAAILIGLASGRIVRFFKLDIRVKILRYHNRWYYLFSGAFNQFPKVRKHKKSSESDIELDFDSMNRLSQNSKKPIMTHADLLISTAEGNALYTGKVVDYQLDPKNPSELSKVILDRAHRYILKENSGYRKKGRLRKIIPGNYLVIECENLLNINLTYVYEEYKDYIQGKWPSVLMGVINVATLLLMLMFIFKFSFIEYSRYKNLFEYSFFKRIGIWAFIVQVLFIFNPIRESTENKGKYKWLRISSNEDIFYFIAKLVIAIILGIVLWIF